MTWYDKIIVNTAMYIICVCWKSDYLAHRWERRYSAGVRRRHRARAEARAWRRVGRWLANETNRPRGPALTDGPRGLGPAPRTLRPGKGR